MGLCDACDSVCSIPRARAHIEKQYGKPCHKRHRKAEAVSVTCLIRFLGGEAPLTSHFGDVLPLRAVLEALPPDAQVPAGWVLERLDQEGLEVPSGDQWLTTGEAAVLLRVSEATVRRWCIAGTLVGVTRQGRAWRIPESACVPRSASAGAGEGSRRTRPITRPTDARRRMPAGLSAWQKKQAATRAGE